jgi:hypothetical protein
MRPGLRSLAIGQVPVSPADRVQTAGLNVICPTWRCGRWTEISARLRFAAIGKRTCEILRGFLSFSKLAEHCRYDLSQVSAPPLERILTLAKKFVPLIDRSNTRNCTGLVIEYFIGNVRSNSQARHPGHTRAS